MKNIKYVKWHKQTELEKIAASLHSKHGLEVPIDIDYLIEMHGLEILDINRLKEDFNLYGLLAKIKGKFIVFTSRGDLKTTNYYTNFTLAEELSHFILHREYFSDVDDLNEAAEFYIKLKSESEIKIELDAKYLAGAILLPKENLRKKVMEIYEKGKPTFLQLMRDGDKDICEKIIQAIAAPLTDFYHVQDGPITYRLRGSVIGFRDFLKGVYKQCKDF